MKLNEVSVPEDLSPDRIYLFTAIRSHPLNFLWGDDPDDNRPICWGKDPTDQVTPLKPLPRKDYLRKSVQRWYEKQTLIIIKSRQMTITWTIGVGCQLWLAQFTPHRLIFLQSKKEEDSFDLVTRCKLMYENEPQWLRELCPPKRPVLLQPKSEFELRNGSKIVGIPQGQHQVRQYAPSSLFCDECCFQDKVDEMLGAIQPAMTQGASRLTLVSSAYPNQTIMDLLDPRYLSYDGSEEDSMPTASLSSKYPA